MSEPKKKLLGVILAGGQSSRMGLDKATLPIAGTTLLEYMRAKLQSAGLTEVVICRNAPGYLNDTIAQLGPLGALYTLSQRYPGRQALIIPVDMPLLSEVTLQHFQAAALASEAIDSQSPATLGQQIFPLYLPFTPTVNEALSQRVNQPDDLSIAALLRETGVRRLSDLAHKAGNDELLNANTPQQWQTILSKVKTQSSTAK